MTTSEELLRGPRGRRLALASLTNANEAVRSAVMRRSHELDPNPGTLFRVGGNDTQVVDDPVYTDDDVAGLIREVDVASCSPDMIRLAMRETVDHAMYWQSPDGADVLAASRSVGDSLASMAEHVVALMPNLNAPMATAQWAIDWRADSDSAPIAREPARVLAEWTEEQLDSEDTAARERPSTLGAGPSGTWWSVPQQLLTTRANRLDAIELVEDPLGWEIATLIPIRGTGRILEVNSGETWAELCREYPMEVTASRRHDWFRVTGRDRHWLIPDWQRVSAQWDAVHLTTLGYLEAATREIPIDTDYSSVMGGWSPDATLWLNDVAREWGEPRQQWRRLDDEDTWTMDTGAGPA